VIDTGVDYTHRDIDDNMWVNTGEIPNNGLDDDDNGYIDDIYGYDFCYYDNNPKDDHGHGTHCAGIIAAEGDNGSDIVGICWDAKIMALKFLDAGGSGWTSDAVEAFYYAVDNGADVTSNSWGGGGYSETMEDAINYADSQGVIMVAAAGNDNSTAPHYPAYHDNMISVASTNSNDQKASFSNYGDWVDIAAPGVDVLSLRANETSMGTGYGYYTTIASGTSMACPQVAGACALLLSFNPFVTNDEAYDILIGTVDQIADGICLSDGRLNLFNALVAAISSKGNINLERDYYSCSAVVSVLLADRDIEGQGSQEVIITTSGGDLETVLLTESDFTLGIFAGVISVESGPANTEDSVLQISHGQIITAIYEDANDGIGNPATVIDTAQLDCEPPVISNVQIDPRGPEPTITFDTDESTTARVLCGRDCGEPYEVIATNSILATSHTIKLTGVSPETDYSFMIETTDAVGHKTVDDNNGQCYAFTTNCPSDIYVPVQYSTIQEAIDRSWDGGTVWVGDGVYTGHGNRDIDFKGKAITVKSENGPENCIIDCNGTETEPHCGFYFHNSEDSSSILSGFTITNAYVREYNNDGAISCIEASPVITNCIIRNNSSTGIWCVGATLTITNCNISNNSGSGIACGHKYFYPISYCTVTNCTISNNFGSGLYGCETITNCTISGNSGTGILYCDGPISNCTISGNSTDRGGGGLRECHGSINSCVFSGNFASAGAGMYDCTASVTNCTFTNNFASWGSGVCNSEGTITDCTFIGNTATWGGGVMDYYGLITNCIFSNNSAVYGGGVCDSEGTIINCAITNNSAKLKGGGIGDYNGSIINCTIVNNSAQEYGGGIYCYNNNTTITNSILWNNTAPSGPEIALLEGYHYSPLDVVKITYSDVQGGLASVYVDPNYTLNWGSGNINIDPLLVLEDYHFTPNSPCIDAGDNTAIPLRLIGPDLDGNPRFYDDPNTVDTGNGTIPIVDIGAVEYNDQVPCIAVSPHILTFYATVGSPEPDSHILSIFNSGGQSLNWSINYDCDWLIVSPITGSSAGDINEVVASVDISGVNHNRNNCKLTIYEQGVVNSPKTVEINLILNRILHVPRQYPTIQAAIDEAWEEDTIIVDPNIYNENINFNGKNITLTSIAPNDAAIVAETVIQGDGTNSVVTLWGQDESSCLAGFTITGGYAFGDFPDNDAGGGISGNGSDAAIINCVITGNSAKWGGGLSDCEGPITNCTIIGNSAGEDGGGLLFCRGPITNCAISGNSAGGDGGGMLVNKSSVTNCTFSGNFAYGYGGGIYNYKSDLTLTNCIFWANRDSGDMDESAQIRTNKGTLVVNYSCIQGWIGSLGGIGNIGADPCFVEAGFWDANRTPDICYDDFWVDGDYHLLPDSFCINTGDPNYIADTNETDLEGNPRVIGGRIDMGAYEADYIEVPMKFTPQALNPNNKSKWLKAHLVLPEGFAVEDVDTDTPAVIAPFGVQSCKIKVLLNDEGLVRVEATFRRSDLCDSITGYDQNIEVMVIGRFTNGRYFYGTDTIKVTDRAFDHLAVLVSHWLQEDYSKPHWCGGSDINQDSVVNFIDFALLAPCCIKVIKQ
jgi:hypothetical protein